MESEIPSLGGKNGTGKCQIFLKIPLPSSGGTDEGRDSAFGGQRQNGKWFEFYNCYILRTPSFADHIFIKIPLTPSGGTDGVRDSVLGGQKRNGKSFFIFYISHRFYEGEMQEKVYLFTDEYEIYCIF